MTKELLKATLPMYISVNAVLLLLLLLAFFLGIPGRDSFVIANVAAAFVSLQIIVSVGILYYLRDVDEEYPSDIH